MKPSWFNRIPAYKIQIMSRIALALVFAMVGFGAFYVAIVTPYDGVCLLAFVMSAIAITCAIGIAAERER